MGNRRPMDRRTVIHEPSCSRDGSALGGKTVLVGFIQGMSEQRSDLKAQ